MQNLMKYVVWFICGAILLLIEPIEGSVSIQTLRQCFITNLMFDELAKTTTAKIIG